MKESCTRLTRRGFREADEIMMVGGKKKRTSASSIVSFTSPSPHTQTPQKSHSVSFVFQLLIAAHRNNTMAPTKRLYRWRCANTGDQRHNTGVCGRISTLPPIEAVKITTAHPNEKYGSESRGYDHCQLSCGI